MRALVTGGTGFIGAHLVRCLLSEDMDVRVLHRSTSDTSIFEGRRVELLTGDLAAPASLREAVRGMDLVFHLAADYRLAGRAPDRMHTVNVEGTSQVLRAASEAGVPRIVYTSSAVTVRCPDAEGAGTEEDFVEPHECRGTYQLTKVLAEQEVWAMIRGGAPITIVNPSTVIGPGDRRPTPMGRLIVEYLKGRVPAFLDAVVNFVYVGDVARGHWLAATRGRVGERYILANETLALGGFFGILSQVSGRPAPRVKIPYIVALASGMVGTTWSRVAGGEPLASLDGVRMARIPMRYDAGKARTELGLPRTPIRTAAEEAVAWFESLEFTAPRGPR